MCRWMPRVIQRIKPFMSDESIRGGTRWNSEVAKVLAATDFGVLCMTRENLLSEWIHYEAGALSKDLERNRVVPIRLGIRETDIKYPLAQFQSIEPDHASFLKLFLDINDLMGENRIHESVVEDAFARTWSEFEDTVVRVLATSPAEDAADAPPTPAISLDDVLVEMREQSRMMVDVNERILAVIRRSPVSRQLPDVIDSRDRTQLSHDARAAFGERYVYGSVTPDRGGFVAHLRGEPLSSDGHLQREIGQMNSRFSIGVRYLSDQEADEYEERRDQRMKARALERQRKLEDDKTA